MSGLRLLPICCRLAPHKPERAKCVPSPSCPERVSSGLIQRTTADLDSLSQHEAHSCNFRYAGGRRVGVARCRLRPTRRQERRQVGSIDNGAPGFHAGKSRATPDGNGGYGTGASIHQCGAAGDQFRHSCRRFGGTAAAIGASAFDSARAIGEPDARTGNNRPSPARRGCVPRKRRLIGYRSTARV